MALLMPRHPKSEAEMEKAVHQLEFKDVVNTFVDLAGVVVAGTVGGVQSQRAVNYWRSGIKQSNREAQLRFGLRLALMIGQHGGRGATQAWFKGANSMLGDRSPAAVLAADFSETTQQRLLAAAREITA